MTYGDDFVAIDDSQALDGPSYPTAFGIELTPKILGILAAIVGLAAAFFLYTRLVQPVQQRKSEIAERVNTKEDTLENREANLQEIQEVQAELDEALDQREAIYSLLGTPASLDTLLLDINQQIKSSNASIGQAIGSDFDTVNAPLLTSIGLTATQIDRIRTRFVEDPLLQRFFYTSELGQFSPTGESGLLQDELLYGPELTGQLERQVVDVSFRSLFPQAQNIVRNLERLEPLVIIRNFNQEWAELEGDAQAEDLIGITRPLNTNFTLEVLVPVGDPREPPEPPAPEPVEGEEGAEGEEAAE